ncbi:MAG: hydroxymethylglutaryl-CoA reductase, degradative [Pseudomonadales bacterium]|nr:hydroxymethylglutaryl-CoA reductase, degradative [Pseudomonadales bacterium]
MVSTPPPSKQGSSRISNFFKLSIRERIAALEERKLLPCSDIEALLSEKQILNLITADKMVENVVGIFGLPMGLGLNFLINGNDYVIPLVVEEPSIVAGLSSAARVARLGGGFKATSSEPVLIGQVQMVDIDDPAKAIKALEAHKADILNLANSLHPKMVARGGGAIDIEIYQYSAPEDGREMVVLHLLVDTRDAMGANLVNTACEGIASLLESITGGHVFLRILSNLTDRAITSAEVTIPVNNLEGKGYSGQEVRDGIILASDLAQVDPYRAATHNKGVMNGVDAVVIATGNDWRAVEASAHAYAARNGQYTALTRWYKNGQGDLVGEIEIPLKIGTVGGSLQSNPTVGINHRLLGSPDARDLSNIIGCVGLAQNFAALRALSTDGIQQGHMTLHARSVANTAKVPAAQFDQVVDLLIESGDIKVWKAREIMNALRAHIPVTKRDAEPRSTACGKIILLGEHAVVYGRHAIATPIPLAIEARVKDASDGVHLLIPRWGIEQRLKSLQEHPQGIEAILATLLKTLELEDRSMEIEIFPNIPRAMGLGGSSALAVALIRALESHFNLNLNDKTINALAFECETAAHGTPSGVDNTIATYGKTLLFRKTHEFEFSELIPGAEVPLVIGISGRESLTAGMVGKVRSAWQNQPQRYENLFDRIEELTLAGAEAIRCGDLADLGETMNLCHGILNGLQLSTPQIEELVHLCRENGALGAKLTGGGGGGSMIALCPQPGPVVAAIESAGYQALTVTIGAS